MGDRPRAGGALLAPDIPTLVSPSPHEPRQGKQHAHTQQVAKHSVMVRQVGALQVMRWRARLAVPLERMPSSGRRMDTWILSDTQEKA
eukprot:1338130-Prymnesium_polylepis.1